LLHAIGHEFHRLHPRATIIYMSAEKFMVEFVAALRANETLRFKQQLRSADLLMIDDVQFIAGKESTQEEFFHTMNEIISAGRRLVISSDRAPQDLDGIEPRILSRLSWGLVADINAADLELRLNIIHKKLESLPDVKVPEDVIGFLARRISSNVRELEGALNRISAYSLMQQRPITLEFVAEVLANILRANQRRVSIDEIQTKVSEHYRIRKAEMTSARRAREVARPRQVAMYLSKQLTPRSLPEIGRRFGGRDHTHGDPRRPPDRAAAFRGPGAGQRYSFVDPSARRLTAALADPPAQRLTAALADPPAEAEVDRRTGQWRFTGRNTAIFLRSPQSSTVRSGARRMRSAAHPSSRAPPASPNLPARCCGSREYDRRAAPRHRRDAGTANNRSRSKALPAAGQGHGQ
jgi:hypothetical protein